MKWAGLLPTLVGLPAFSADAYCKDCAGGMSFLAFLLVAGILILTFVVAVALW